MRAAGVHSVVILSWLLRSTSKEQKDSRIRTELEVSLIYTLLSTGSLQTLLRHALSQGKGEELRSQLWSVRGEK